MSQFEKRLAALRNNPKDAHFDDALWVARRFFDEKAGGKHSHVFTRAGWSGSLNFQPRRDGKAHRYQVEQLIEAIDELGLTDDQ